MFKMRKMIGKNVYEEETKFRLHDFSSTWYYCQRRLRGQSSPEAGLVDIWYFERIF